MRKWKTAIVMNAGEKKYIQTNKIKVNRGIFQGDACYHTWAC